MHEVANLWEEGKVEGKVISEGRVAEKKEQKERRKTYRLFDSD